MMPVLFVGHGSPMNAIEQNTFTEKWSKIGRNYVPDAILMISAHWFTKGLKTQNEENPEKINDMYGFPKALYEHEYPAKGLKSLADSITEKLSPLVAIDNTWGIDHGAWSVLTHMYPKADIPVVQLSVDQNSSPQALYDLGKKLRSLRNDNILIIGSGNVVHNLRMMTPKLEASYDWAQRFDDAIHDAVMSGNHELCIEYSSLGQDAHLSVPTTEHYDPLLYILGATRPEDTVTAFNRTCVLGSISMTSYLFE